MSFQNICYLSLVSFRRFTVTLPEILSILYLNDILVSFDVVNFFPSVLIGGTLNIEKGQLEGDSSLSTQTDLPIAGVMELLELYVKSVLSVL